MNYALEAPREGHIWDFYYDLLLGFVDRKGHADVPKHHIEKGFALGIWVNKQRVNRRFLSPERVAALEEIECWFWGQKAESTLPPNPLVRQMRSPTEEKAARSSARTNLEPQERAMPTGSPVVMRVDSPSDNKLSLNDRVVCESDDKDEASDVQFDEKTWLLRYELLVQFTNREGHCLVPRKHKEDNFKLGKWLHRQRHTRFVLPEKLRAMLESLDGWTWDTEQTPLMVLRSLFKDYHDREGTVEVPLDHVEHGIKLGVWVERQHRLYRKGALDEETVKMLESLPGWEWQVDTESEILQGAPADDLEPFVREVWNILLGYGTVGDVYAADIVVRALHEAGKLEECTVRIGSEVLRRISQAFDRCVEVGMMERPEKGKIQTVGRKD